MLLLDPPIHIKKGYKAYDSGIRDNVFLLDVTGQPYVGQVDLRILFYLSQQGKCAIAEFQRPLVQRLLGQLLTISCADVVRRLYALA